MAQVALGVFIAMNGIDLSCVLKSVKTSGQADLKDSTTLCATDSKTFQKGLTDRTISAEGFFRASEFTVADANGLFESAMTERTADRLLLFGRDGSTFGSVAEMFNVRQVKKDVDTTVGELIMASMEAKVTKSDTADGYNRGVFLLTNPAITVSQTTGSSYDNAAGDTGYILHIFVLDSDQEENNATIKIQHSTNNSTWVDLVASATYGTYTATEVKSTVTSVNRYVRAVASTSDGTASIAVAMKIGYTG